MNRDIKRDLFGKIVYKFNKQLAVVGQYYMWQKAAYKEAKKLHATKQFDVAHVISIADFRFPGYLWKLNIPFIFGPVGGAQETPKCLIDYIKGHEKNEKFRAWMNKLLIMLPNYKKALSHADLIYCSNAETEEVIRKKVREIAPSLFRNINFAFYDDRRCAEFLWDLL